MTEDYQKYQVASADGYQLETRVYQANGDHNNALLIAGATGVPQRYYKRFARLMTTKGFTVISFDYRGIADSKYQSLKGFDASVLDWAFKDYKSVLQWTLKEYGSPYVIGHSLGGHIFGIVADSEKTEGLITFGTGAGWHGWMPLLEKYRVAFLWNILGPALVPFYGYLPSKLVGIGENLPYQVYKQWKHWCSFPHYWFDDPQFEYTDNFAHITVPVTAVNSTDDVWAPPKSAEAFMKHYRNASLKYETITNTDWGVKNIGHMGYFHSDCLHQTATLIMDKTKT